MVTGAMLPACAAIPASRTEGRRADGRKRRSAARIARLCALDAPEIRAVRRHEGCYPTAFMLNCAWISKRLEVAEALLRTRHFEKSLAIVADVDDEIVRGKPTLPPLVRVPQSIFDRMEHVRSTAETGLRLAELVQTRGRAPLRLDVIAALERTLH